MVGDLRRRRGRRARRRVLEAADHPQRRRLAAARGAEQREEVAALDRERELVDGGHLAEALGDILEMDVGLAALQRLERGAVVAGCLGRRRRRSRSSAHVLAEPRSLLPAMRHLRADSEMLVDPDGTGLELAGGALRAEHVVSPGRGREPVAGVRDDLQRLRRTRDDELARRRRSGRRRSKASFRRSSKDVIHGDR